MMQFLWPLPLLVLLLCVDAFEENPKEDRHGVKAASICEVCKLLAAELIDRLQETQTHDVLKLGYGMNNKKEIKYETSELRLMEVLHEPHICDRMWQYQLHKERKDSTRFAKGTPETFKALEGLVKRGVEVKMDIPQDMWHQPSAETSSLYKQCVPMVTEYEDDIEQWYHHHQGKQDLLFYLCRDRVLRGKSDACLYERLPEEQENESNKKTKTEL